MSYGAAPARAPGQPVVRRRLGRRARFAATVAVLGPGIVSGFADNDAGGITTYSLAGAKFGYDLLWVILVTQVALFVTQEIGARIGLATGQGLTGLIRERFGVRWAAFAALTMIAANLGSTVSEFAGISAALSLFGVPVPVSAILAALAVITLISRGSFSRVQYFFVGIGLLVSAAYVVSAVLAHPDWGRAASSLVIPHGTFSGAYMLAVVGTVGTTITPWGQGFIQAYVVDKRLRSEDLAAERLDVLIGVLITNVIAAFIVIACAATLWATGQHEIRDAAAAASALGPLAGPVASTLFAVGLLAASLLGLGVVPLASAYTACEAFGWEQGVDWRWREAPAFYGLLAFFILFAAAFLLIPGLPLIQVMFSAQVINGLLLPIILIFVMLLAGDRRIMGDLASGRVNLGMGWLVTALLVVMSVVLVVTALAG
ncbi:MAG TPA: Nramp family divalent metal transporter [Candidatus Deferrimicrobium sp.]|nr:Nramp family divalent metal transporter [Candidatus Deferrimicrobium sp.]